GSASPGTQASTSAWVRSAEARVSGVPRVQYDQASPTPGCAATRCVSAAPAAATSGSSTSPWRAVTSTATLGLPVENRSASAARAASDSEPGASKRFSDRASTAPAASTASSASTSPDRTSTRRGAAVTRRPGIERPPRNTSELSCLQITSHCSHCPHDIHRLLSFAGSRSSVRSMTGEDVVVDLKALDAQALPRVGGKAANLGELIAAGFPVPPGFVVTTAAYRRVAAALEVPDPARARE